MLLALREADRYEPGELGNGKGDETGDDVD